MIKFNTKVSDFKKSLLTLMSGTIIAQLIPIAISPVLTRLYTPEDFGGFALFISIASIITVISSARYDQAIVLPKKDEEAFNLLILSCIITCVISVILFILIFLWGNHIASLFENKSIKNWFYLLPISVFLTGIYQNFNSWSIRKKYFKNLALNRITQSSLSGSSQLLIGYNKANSSIGLILGGIIGQFITTFNFIFKIWKKDKSFLKRISWIKQIALFKRYLSFLKYGVPALLTSAIARQSFIILISNFINSVTVGYVNIIQRIVSIPSSILGKNLGDVFYQHISQISKKDSYKPILSFTKKLFLYSLISHFIVYIILDNFFVLFFGSDWSKGLYLLKYLIIVSCFSFIFSPLSILFNYFEIQKINLYWQLIWLITNILIFYIYNSTQWSIEKLFLIYTIKQVLLYLIGIIGFLIISNKKQHEY